MKPRGAIENQGEIWGCQPKPAAVAGKWEACHILRGGASLAPNASFPRCRMAAFHVERRELAFLVRYDARHLICAWGNRRASCSEASSNRKARKASMIWIRAGQDSRNGDGQPVKDTG